VYSGAFLILTSGHLRCLDHPNDAIMRFPVMKFWLGESSRNNPKGIVYLMGGLFILLSSYHWLLGDQHYFTVQGRDHKCTVVTSSLALDCTESSYGNLQHYWYSLVTYCSTLACDFKLWTFLRYRQW